jgi:hypothetical protein
MAKLTSRTRSISGKFSDNEALLVQQYCARIAVSPSALVRDVVLREIGAQTMRAGGTSERHMKLFVAVMRRTVGEDELDAESLEKLIAQYAPEALEKHEKEVTYA